LFMTVIQLRLSCCSQVSAVDIKFMCVSPEIGILKINALKEYNQLVKEISIV
jgi:hypothetical protein